VKLPSSERYWTVVDEDYQVVGVADEYLHHMRLGRDAAESTTKAYAESLALYLRWCEQTGRDWRTAADRLGAFVTWLRHTPSDPESRKPPALCFRCSRRSQTSRGRPPYVGPGR
jgi:hypothetical protein